MPRTARAPAANDCSHVLNRGNGRAEVFHHPQDDAAFLDRIAQVSARRPMRVLGDSLLPNHFHLSVQPDADGNLGRWMHWLLTTHVRHYRRHYGISGPVWQGRFKPFPCQDDDHLLTALRYVERNALRAGLTERAQLWPDGSLFVADGWPAPVPLALRPVHLDDAWVDRVNQPTSEAGLSALRRCVTRGSPFGTEPWATRAAEALRLGSTLRPRGRPRKDLRSRMSRFRPSCPVFPHPRPPDF